MTKIYACQKSLFALLFTFISITALAQPTVLGTQLVNGGYTTYDLSTVGGFKQYRLQASSGAATGTRNWEFATGTAGSTNYSTNWRPYTAGNTLSVNAFIPTSFANGAKYNTGSGGASGLLPAITSGNYYTFNVSNNSAADNVMSLLETTFDPVTISSVSQANGTYASRTVTITTSGTPNAGENIFVRYSTNSFTSSTIVQATGSGTSWSATIPWQSSAVSFYVYTSNRSKTSIDADVVTYGQGVHDMSTLNVNNNSGSNYSWTPASGTIIVSSAGGSFATPQTYSTFTVAGGAFAALNAASAGTGAVTILITANVTNAETGATSLNASANWTSIGIRPNGARTVSGTQSAGTVMMNFDGADNVTIDGLNDGTNSLIISSLTSSTSSNTATIRFINDATSNTITRCTILSSFNSTTASTNGGCIHFSTATTTGNDNNTISYCNLSTSGTTLTKCISASGSTGSSGAENSGIVIDNNNIYDYYISGASNGIYLNTGNQSWTITNNKFYQTASRSLGASGTVNGIFISNNGNNAGGFTITNNVIGYSAAYTAQGASSSGTTVTVPSTSGLTVGMSVTVTSGTGQFASSTTVATIPTSTTFTVSATPTVSLSGASIGAGSGSMTYNGGSTLTFNAINVTQSATAGSTTTISNNLISNFTYSGTATSSAFTGITNGTSSISQTETININNNIVQNVSFAAITSGSMTGISPGNAATLTCNSNNINTFSRSAGSTGVMYGIVMASPTTSTYNSNTITGFTYTSASATGSIYGIYSNSSAATVTCNSNTITNLTSTSTSTFSIYGIYEFGVSGNKTFQSNIINNLSTSGTSATIYGINEQTGTTNTYSSNVINTISGCATAYPIYVNGGTTNNVYKNKIYDISSASTTGRVFGIYVNSGTTCNAYNNLIGDLRATASTQTAPTPSVVGMYVAGGTNANFYNNTVRLAASSSGTNFGTACVYSLTTTTSFLMSNNLLVNVSTKSGTGKTIAFQRSGTGFTNYSSSSNKNSYYAGTASADNLLFYDGTNSDQTLAAIKSRLSPADQGSYAENPTFASTTGSAATFLHISAGTSTQLESGGVNNPSSGLYTDDFDGDTRPGPTGSVNGGASSYDVGADEFDGIPVDLTAPSISYTSFSNTLCTTDRTISATITDASGVNGTAGTRPRLYYKKSGDANNYVGNTNADNGWKYVEASGSTSPFSFTTDYSLLQSAVAAGDVIQYFVVAQDNVTPTPNVAINSGTFAATPSSVALTSAAFAIGGSINSYTVLSGGLGSDVTIGASGTYTSLTGASGSLFAAINAGGLTANINATILDASVSESGATALNQISYGCATYTLTIKPAAGVTATLTGSLASNALIRLNGADNVIIDGSNNGSSSRDLTITNTSTTAPSAVSIISTGTGAGATSNTIKNCNISTGVVAAASYGIAVGGSTPGTSGADNDNVTIQNNNISAATIGIYANGTAATSTGGNDNLSVTGNTVTISNSAYTGVIGIQLGNSVTSTVSQNSLSVSVNSSGTTPVGISLENGFVSSTVTRNLISAVTTANTGGYGGRGITIGTNTASSSLTISNNVIYGVNGSNFSGFGNSSSMGIAIGIVGSSSTLTTTAGGINLYYNSVNMYGSYSYAAACLTAALYVGSGASALDIRNNSFTNSMNNTNGSGTASKNYAIYSAVANTAFSTINYNDYWVSGTQGVYGFLTSDRTNLAGIQTGFGQNVNSITADPLYNSNTNLIPSIGSPLVSAAVTGTGVTVDYLGTSRSGSTPTIGAYETAVDGVAPSISYTNLTSPDCSGSDRTLSVTITDGTGVPTSGTLRPRIYYRKGAGSWFSQPGTLSSGSATNGVWSFTIVAADMGTLNAGDLISYYLIAQDNAGTPNIGSSPAAGLVATDVNTVTTAPTSPNSYTIGYTLNGSYTVGSGGTFTTLTAAVNAYNNACNITGPVTFLLTDATYSGSETFPIVLNASAYSSATNTLTIKPAASITPAITGSGTGALLKINGADYIILDGSNTTGGTTRDLTITNSSAAASTAVIWLASVNASNGATNDTVKNCNIIGSASTVTDCGIISSGASYGAAADVANSNNAYQNNNITKALTGIAVVGPAANESGTLISGNSIGSAVAASKMGISGIEIYNQQNVSVTTNTIFGVTTSTTSTASGIYAAGTFSGGSITLNNISDIKNTNSSGYGAHGIGLYSATTTGNLTVSNNMVYNVTGNGYASGATEADNGYGIMINTGGGYNVYFNTVSLSVNQAVAGISASINIASAVTALNIRNNIFSNSQTTGTRYAIYTAGTASGFTTINYNDYSSAGSVGFLTSARATLANWQTASTQDAQSVAIAPVFTSATDLHLVPASNTSLNNLGTGISGITTDYDVTSRNLTTPDMGADEFVLANTASWIGGTSVQWPTATNWDANSVPSATTNVTVPTAAPNMPVLQGNVTINNLVLNASTTASINGNTLTINGAVSGSGTITGSASSNLVIGGTAGTIQFTTGSTNNYLKDLTIGSSGSMTIGSNELNIAAGASAGTVTVANGGLLTTGGYLNLKSDANGTARVAANGSGSTYISGDVTVERYIPANANRAWRMLGVPTKGGQTIKQAWQENQPAGDLTLSGKGTQITSNSGSWAANGFDFLTGGNSILSYDASIDSWMGNYGKSLQTSNTIENTEAYMLYVRGDRTIAPGPGSITATTLRSKGTLYQGTQTGIIVGAAQYLPIANLYASSIDFRLLSKTGDIDSVFYVWDPKLTGGYGLGGYQTLTYSGGNFLINPGGGSFGAMASTMDTIQSGQGFFVHSTTSGGTIVFNESAKVSGSRSDPFTPLTIGERFATRMFAINGGNNDLADGTLTLYDAANNNAVDGSDAKKIANFGENLGMLRDGKLLATEQRELIGVTDTIYLNGTGFKQQNYQFEFTADNLNHPNLLGKLVDNYLVTNTPIDLNGTTLYNFTVNSDPASSAANRFKVIFYPSGPLPVTITSIKAYQQGSNVAVEWKVENQINISKYEVEKSADGRNFSKVGTQNATGINGASVTYNWLDVAPFNGDNFYRVRSIGVAGDVKYSSIVKVKMGKGAAAIAVYPNPVVNHTVAVEFSNMDKGLYTVRLVNAIGQLLMSKQINHAGGNATQTMVLDNSVAKGSYQLEVIKPDGSKQVTKLSVME